MTSAQLYDLLRDAGVEFSILEVFDGTRTIEVLVDEGDQE